MKIKMSKTDEEIKQIRKQLKTLEKKQEEEKLEKESINDDNRFAKEVNTKGWVD